MRTRIHSLLITLVLPVFALAQSQPEVIHLRENGAPGFENRKDNPEQDNDWWIG